MKIVAIDTSNLTRSVNLSLEYSGRAPGTACATASFFVARQAARDTHKASLSGIDSELGVTFIPKLVTRGPRKGLPTKKRSGTYNVENTAAMMIALARMWPKSKTNQRENMRWLIDRAGFSPGQGKAGFLAKLIAYAQTMVKLRHKSIAFIASAPLFIVRDMEPYVPPQYRRGAAGVDGQALLAQKSAKDAKGQGMLNISGNNAMATGEATIGGGTPANLSQRHNEAMWQWLAPAIQSAIHAEAIKQLDYVSRQEMKRRTQQFALTGTVIDI